MSTSDQDQSVDTPIAAPEESAEAEETGAAEAAEETKATGRAGSVAESEDEETTGTSGTSGTSGTTGTGGEGGGADASGRQAGAVGERRLTPRQARRLRIVLSSVGMAAMAVVLALRIASRSSVLVVGVYGLALILCGIVIELSRNGRTRLGSWLLGLGLIAAIGSDWLLIP
ncbi:hypothetical protein [Streptomyces sp. NPDC059783]|uniref:hypothetical protein n=1 Tax=Streptomyces sp. NPDC059783 TaxID=3346944 RepID=UPI003650CCD3